MTAALDALRAVDFNWTMPLQSIWQDPIHDVPQVHGELRRELADKLDELPRETKSPLGWVLVGTGGTGKTHLLSHLRGEARKRGYGFVLVDMTDVRDFWSTACLGYLKSLEQSYQEDQFQYQVLLEKFIGQRTWTIQDQKGSRPGSPAEIVDILIGRSKTTNLARDMQVVLGAFARRHPAETRRYQDVIRALIVLNSADFNISNAGHTWLQGQCLEEEDRQALGFQTVQAQPRFLVEALSWLMSLCGPTVLALDQLDPIVSQLHAAAANFQSEEASEEIRAARSIIDGIAGGLAALFDVTHRTFRVVSCLEATWEILRKWSLPSNLARYESPRALKVMAHADVAEAIVLARLEPAYRQAGFQPPYSSYPFRRQAFERLQGVFPRHLLQLCYEHRKHCLHQGTVSELSDFRERETGPPEPQATADALAPLDQKFKALYQQAEPAWLLEEKKEDERLAPLLQSACRLLLKEKPLPRGVDGIVDVEFTGGNTTKSLHARLRLVYHDQGEREEHFSLRALQWNNPRAFQNRLNLAMTAAGIDRSLGFRRLVVVRSLELPGGAVTEKLMAKFIKAGGLMVVPAEEELRTLWALSQLEMAGKEDLDDWLLTRRPLSQMNLICQSVPILCPGNQKLPVEREACSEIDPAQKPCAPDSPFLPGEREGTGDSSSSGPARPGPKRLDHQENLARPMSSTSSAPPPRTRPRPESLARPSTSSSPPKTKAEARPESLARPVPAGGKIILGYRLLGNSEGPAVTMPVELLEKHTVVLAGAGSGKTVLLRRLVEEATLLGVPAIVIDCANDLSALGDPWPQIPDCFHEEDGAKARSYFAQTDVVIWTPGKEAGNSLRLEPLPDFRPVADNPDELDDAVTMATAGLKDLAIAGAASTVPQREAILRSAVRFFAQNGGGDLACFIEVLGNLPPEAGLGINKETRLARDMADRLKAQCETNVLLRSSGQGLDPAVLFGDEVEADPGSPRRRRPRVSVINFVGLPTPDVQRLFLNQLAMTLFSWIKKNPRPADRTLRGLLVIDEAKDFVPAIKASVCKDSLMRLTAQARKYHLGVVFATQHPREIENSLIGNCSTHYYGKANSPAAIETIREQIALRGGCGDDVPTLPKGHFYVYNADADLRAPTKVGIPLCLSHHPPNPLTEEDILQRAGRWPKPIAPGRT